VKDNLIARRVEAARAGNNSYVICRLASGWLVVGDVQPRPGYCLLLADPVRPCLNSLSDDDRVAYLLDMSRIGDALLKVTGAVRINYETLGNTEPALHTHIIPRYRDEPMWRSVLPTSLSYPRIFAPRFNPEKQAGFIANMRDELHRPLAANN